MSITNQQSPRSKKERGDSSELANLKNDDTPNSRDIIGLKHNFSGIKIDNEALINPIRNNSLTVPFINLKNKIQSTVFMKKYTSIFKSWSLMFQVLFCYCSLMAIFMTVLIVTKVIQINSLLDTQTKKNYYTSVVKQMLDIQRDVKIELDKINTREYAGTFQSQLLFLRIYSEELINHGVLKGETFDSASLAKPELMTLYQNINPSFRLNKTLSDIMQYDTKDNQFSNLIPFFFHIIPVIYIHLKIQGMPMISFNFMGYTLNNPNTKQTYFKYPIETNMISSWTTIQNHQISDFVFDPIGQTYVNDIQFSTDITLNTELKTKAKKVNWYYTYEQDMINNNKEVANRIITLYHILPNKKKIENYINYYAHTNILPNDTDTYYMHFSIRIDKANMFHSYLIKNEDGNTKNFDYLSILSYPDIDKYVTIDPDDKIYDWDYNIDDDNPIISYTPKFISDFFLYATQHNSLVQSVRPETDIVSPWSYIFKYSNMKELNTAYSKGLPFEEDIALFSLLLFLNNLFIYNKRNPYKEGDTDIFPNISTDNCPCLDINIESYYEIILNKTDCLNEYCFYNDCNNTNPFYINFEEVSYMPNCYCLPLYCKDPLQNTKTKFHDRIFNKLGDDIDYSFNNRSKPSTEYMNWTSSELKCRINFYQKNGKGESSFDIKAFHQSVPSLDLSSMFVFYLSNNYQIINNIVNQFKTYVDEIKWIIYIIYFILLACTVVGLTIFMIFNVRKLTNRMNEIKLSISDIIRKPDEKDKTISPTSSIKKDEQSVTMSNDDHKVINGLEEEKVELSNSEYLDKDDPKKKNSIKESNNPNTNLDELDQLKKVIYDHRSDFMIDFTTHENINENLKDLTDQYREITNVLKYKQKLFPKKSKKDESEEDKEAKIKSDNEKKKMQEMSLNIINELFSLSTKEIIDFSQLKTNLYYRERNQKSVLNLSNAINLLEDDKRSFDNEICSPGKFKNAMKYYYENIHEYWMKSLVKKQKEEDD